MANQNTLVPLWCMGCGSIEEDNDEVYCGVYAETHPEIKSISEQAAVCQKEHKGKSGSWKIVPTPVLVCPICREACEDPDLTISEADKSVHFCKCGAHLKGVEQIHG